MISSRVCVMCNISKSKLYRTSTFFFAIACFVMSQAVMAADKKEAVSEVEIKEILNSHLDSISRLANGDKLQNLMSQLYASPQSIDNIRKVSATWKTEQPNSTKDKILNGEIGQFIDVRMKKSANVYSRGYILDKKGVVVGASPITENYWKIGDKLFLDVYADKTGKGVISPRVHDNLTDQDVYWIAVPVKNQLQKFLGVMVMGIKADHVVTHAQENRMLNKDGKDGNSAMHHGH